MPFKVATHSIERAIASLTPAGTLELSFFGGEPLLEAELISEVIDFARCQCERARASLSLSMTTNGTIDSDSAWKLMSDSGLNLTVSFDGIPEIHDRHRVDVEGRGSSARTLATLRRLIAEGRSIQVIMVVRPDTVESMPEALLFLRDLGVDQVIPSLDLWTAWNAADILKLERTLGHCASIWRDSLPRFGVSWFNEKAVQLGGVPMNSTARCGFGSGELAVAPSGNLYPCERVIGEDTGDSPLRLDGHALHGENFLTLAARPTLACEGCGLSCACSNWVRTGNLQRSDELLQTLDRTCLRETLRVLTEVVVTPATA
jgi:uncharacterized protein